MRKIFLSQEELEVKGEMGQGTSVLNKEARVSLRTFAASGDRYVGPKYGPGYVGPEKEGGTMGIQSRRFSNLK